VSFVFCFIKVRDITTKMSKEPNNDLDIIIGVFKVLIYGVIYLAMLLAFIAMVIIMLIRNIQ
jgi:hypothetical protein